MKTYGRVPDSTQYLLRGSTSPNCQAVCGIARLGPFQEGEANRQICLVFWILSRVSPETILRASEGQFIYCLFIDSLSFCFACMMDPYEAIVPEYCPHAIRACVIVVIWQSFTVIGAIFAVFIWFSSILWFPARPRHARLDGKCDHRHSLSVDALIGRVQHGSARIHAIRMPMNHLPPNMPCDVLPSLLILSFLLPNVILYPIRDRHGRPTTGSSTQLTVAVPLFVWLLLSVGEGAKPFSSTLAFIAFFFAEATWLSFYILFISRGTSSQCGGCIPCRRFSQNMNGMHLQRSGLFLL